MNTIIRATSSADFLAVVPSLAGFTPRNSLVLIPFRGTRSSAAMRVDLPRPDIAPLDFARSAIAYLGRVSGIEAVALVVYTDEHVAETPDDVPFRVLADALMDAATAAGLRIVDALCVCEPGWLSYLTATVELHPHTELPAVPPIAGVGDVSGSQDDGVALPRVDAETRDRVARIAASLRDGASDSDAGEVITEVLAARAALRDLPGLFEAVLDTPHAIAPFAAAAVLSALDELAFRDAALVQWAIDASTARDMLHAQSAFIRSAPPLPGAMADRFLGVGPRPDPDRLRVALATTRQLAALAPAQLRAAPLTIAGWLSWALGHATHAAHYLAEARTADPEYSLAALIEEVMDAVGLPQWCFESSLV